MMRDIRRYDIRSKSVMFLHNRANYAMNVFRVSILHKKLCYCEGTARRAMLVNSCYIS